MRMREYCVLTQRVTRILNIIGRWYGMARIHTKRSLYFLLILLFFLTACVSEPAKEKEESLPTKKLPEDIAGDHEVEENKNTDSIRDLIDSMSLEEKAGQVIMPAFRHDYEGEAILTVSDELKDILEQMKPGGVILFSENIADEQQVIKLINDLQSTADIPLFIAVDEEGGSVSRLTGKGIEFPVLPGNRVLGGIGDTDKVYDSGKLLGKHLAELGFNMNMAPVADVDSNPENPVIGDRSFGSDPKMVARMALAQADGMMEEGIIPVFKHFPGHGDTDQDTHYQQVTLMHPEERMKSVELFPFQKGINKGIPAIMTAHLMVPLYDDTYPATLSEKIITDLLRGKMGFEGLVITDALEMQAIASEWHSSEAAVKALKAGTNLLLMPTEPVKTHEAIVEAVKKDILPEQKLDESVKIILELKKQYNLTSGPLQYHE
ncbi:MAG: glycoside hydrolase family 3 protein [Tindallia sp. MSAO_Bac2]|nr:MAG: glycoside hydrolase family 3 protein [Tindallia sp. MSAO_Bac2]